MTVEIHEQRISSLEEEQRSMRGTVQELSGLMASMGSDVRAMARSVTLFGSKLDELKTHTDDRIDAVRSRTEKKPLEEYAPLLGVLITIFGLAMAPLYWLAFDSNERHVRAEQEIGERGKWFGRLEAEVDHLQSNAHETQRKIERLEDHNLKQADRP